MGLRRQLRKLLGYKEPSGYLNDSYAQEGEDIFLDCLFKSKPNGFYVDIGAHHPIRFSNTYKFYRKGWQGINIDATPGSMAPFNNLRPNDINLEIPVSDKIETLPFYIFDEPALNTFIEEAAKEITRDDFYKIERIENITTKPLRDILRENLKSGTQIDFLTVDAEGFDFKVLNSNDWELYRPGIVLFEADIPIEEISASDVAVLLVSKGYSLYGKTLRTYFFKADNFKVN